MKIINTWFSMPKRFFSEVVYALKNEKSLPPGHLSKFVVGMFLITGSLTYSAGVLTNNNDNYSPPCFDVNFVNVDYDGINMSEPSSEEGAKEVASKILGEISYPMTCYFTIFAVEGGLSANDITTNNGRHSVDHEGLGMTLYRGSSFFISRMMFVSDEQVEIFNEYLGKQLMSNGDVNFVFVGGNENTPPKASVTLIGETAQKVFEIEYDESKDRWLIDKVFGFHKTTESWTP